jgi:hypothetical protein
LSLPPFQRFAPSQSPEVLSTWLKQLEREPHALEEFMAAYLNRRLGHYFERLILFYLLHSPEPRLTVLEHNYPIYQSIKGQKVTLGELDFLLEQDERVLHLETAVKFYLGVTDANGTHWIGPGLADRLDRKLAHLRDHQLPLSHALDFARPIDPVFWVKGVLFHPCSEELPLPPGIATHSTASHWLTRSQAPEYINNEWIVLTKSRWLGGADELTGEIRNRKEILDLHAAPLTQVLMLQHKFSERRLMVVPDDWPDRAREALLTDP